MKVEEIAERLHARPFRRGWMGHCPTELHAHGDRHPSLSIDEGQDGKILLHCFAGCPSEQIVKAMGLRVSDLFPDTPSLKLQDPPEVRAAKRAAADAIAALRSRLTARERELSITIISTDEDGVDEAIVRGLALTVEQELVQVILVEGCAR